MLNKGQTNQTSFKKGLVPWNKRGLWSICETCGVEYPVTAFRLARGSHYCSRKCSSEGLSKRSVTEKILELYLQGVSAKEIASLVNRKVPTVYSALNTRKYRFRKGIQSWGYFKQQFVKDKKCVVCGWDKCLDCCHIIPAAKGGTYEESNLVVLCPNHHRLFDSGKLTIQELNLIKESK